MLQFSVFPQINTTEQHGEGEICFTRRGCSSLRHEFTKCPERQISRSVDWKRRTNAVTPTKLRPFTTGFFFSVRN